MARLAAVKNCDGLDTCISKLVFIGSVLAFLVRVVVESKRMLFLRNVRMRPSQRWQT